MTKKRRDDAMFLARCAQELGRWEDLPELLLNATSLNSALNSADRTFVAVAYKKMGSELRNNIDLIDEIIIHQTSRGAMEKVQALKEFRKQLLGELQILTNNLEGLIERILLPATKTWDDQAFYVELEADFYRANELYDKASSLAHSHLVPTNPIALNIVLNHSVFIYTVLHHKEEAIERVKQALVEVEDYVNSSGTKLNREVQGIVDSMLDNVDKWSVARVEE